MESWMPGFGSSTENRRYGHHWCPRLISSGDWWKITTPWHQIFSHLTTEVLEHTEELTICRGIQWWISAKSTRKIIHHQIRVGHIIFHLVCPRDSVQVQFSSGWHVSTSSNSGRTAIPNWFELRLKKLQFCDFPGELSSHWGGGDGSRNGYFE